MQKEKPSKSCSCKHSQPKKVKTESCQKNQKRGNAKKVKTKKED